MYQIASYMVENRRFLYVDCDVITTNLEYCHEVCSTYTEMIVVDVNYLRTKYN